jgi:hypothetical protein
MTNLKVFKGNLIIHNKSVHAKMKDWGCNQCHYRASTKYEVKIHKKCVYEKIKNLIVTNVTTQLLQMLS